MTFVAISAFGEEDVTYLNEIRVIGGQEDVASPLAPNRITKEKIEKNQFTDVTRALKQTSGVYVREEEGQGLRPNIGLRGTNPDRSKKVVLMEDGVLIGPAPYSAPAAYYTPSMNHVEGLEVYKGFQSVPFGPNSIGGAVNYLSKSIQDKKVDLTGTFGSFGLLNLKGQLSAEDISLGLSRWQSNGFKKIDGGGNSGFKKNDVHIVALRPLGDSEKVNQLKVRLGYSDEDSNETYLGLTKSDFENSPFRRYKSSALDNMKWKHYKVQLEHQLQLNNQSVLKTSIYRHDFSRIWYRLDRFQDNTKKIGDILKDPTGANANFYDILRGQQDSSVVGAGNGNLVQARNDRKYYSQGIQTNYSSYLDASGVTHELEMSFRLHQDQITRDHTYDTWAMSVADGLTLQTANNVDLRNSDFANAKTIGIQDTVRLGAWSAIFAARGEVVDFKNTNRLTGESKSRNDSVLVPGIGLQYQFNDGLTSRVSVNKAVTVAGLDSTGKEKREEATNYELGARFYSADMQVNGDITFFFNDYQNLTGTCTASNGCASNQLDQQINGGKAEIKGLEVSVAKGFQYEKYWLPIFLNATLIEAEFKNAFSSSSGEWGNGNVVRGDPLPYVPEVQYTMGFGLHKGPFEQELTVIYQGAMYDQSVQAGRQKTEAYGIFDWSGKYKQSKDLYYFTKLENILDRKYATSIKPFGYRPGKPQSLSIGMNWTY